MFNWTYFTLLTLAGFYTAFVAHSQKEPVGQQPLWTLSEWAGVTAGLVGLASFAFAPRQISPNDTKNHTNPKVKPAYKANANDARPTRPAVTPAHSLNVHRGCWPTGSFCECATNAV